MKDWDLGLISAGIILISPVDELLTGAITGGASAPVAPLQGAVSALVGGAMVLKGMRVF
jgi:hypothetical protein